MASLEGRSAKDGTNWRVVYYWQGQRKQIKVGVTNRKTALRRKSKIENILALGLDPANEITPKCSELTLSGLLEHDNKWCKHRRQPRAIEQNVRAVRALIKNLGDIQVAQVSPETIEKHLVYLSDRGLAPTTISIHLRTLKAVFQRAISEYKLLSDHPFRSIKPYTIPKRQRPTFLSADQVRIMLDSIEDPDFKRLIEFYLWTGCRRTEALI